LWNTTLTTGSVSIGGALTTGNINIGGGMTTGSVNILSTGGGNVNIGSGDISEVNIANGTLFTTTAYTRIMSGVSSSNTTRMVQIGCNGTGAQSTIVQIGVQDTGTDSEVQIGSGTSTVTINGTVVLTGPVTEIETTVLTVDDKMIELGAVDARTGIDGTLSSTNTLTFAAPISGLLVGQTLTKTAGAGEFGATPTIAAIVSPTEVTVSSAHTTADTITFDIGGATDVTADGGGISLSGTTSKTILWNNATDTWDFNQSIKVTPGSITLDSTPAISASTVDNTVSLFATSTGTINIGDTGSTVRFGGDVDAVAGSTSFFATPNTSSTLFGGLATGDTLTVGGTGTTLSIAGGVHILSKSTTTASDTENIAPVLSGTTYRSAEITIQATQGSAYRISKMLLVHDDTNVDFSEYGIVEVGAAFVATPSYSASLFGGNIEIYTGITQNTTYRVTAIAIPV
jgi:hypothetical protein